MEFSKVELELILYQLRFGMSVGLNEERDKLSKLIEKFKNINKKALYNNNIVVPLQRTSRR